MGLSPFEGLIKQNKDVTMKVFFPSLERMTDDFFINFDLVAKVTTNLKLDPIGPDGKNYLSDLESNEVHFVKLETNVKKTNIKFS